MLNTIYSVIGSDKGDLASIGTPDRRLFHLVIVSQAKWRLLVFAINIHKPKVSTVLRIRLKLAVADKNN